jgi:hypothetical protein
MVSVSVAAATGLVATSGALASRDRPIKCSAPATSATRPIKTTNPMPIHFNALITFLL